MELEKEIHQKKFKNEHQKAMINVIYTANWINYSHARFMKKFGITPQQFNILRILKGQYPAAASVNLLIERMLDKTSNASRLVEKLRLKELVERKQCESDRRQVDVIITQKGLDLLDVMSREMESSEEARLQRITEEEARELNRILDKMRG